MRLTLWALVMLWFLVTASPEWGPATLGAAALRLMILLLVLLAVEATYGPWRPGKPHKPPERRSRH